MRIQEREEERRGEEKAWRSGKEEILKVKKVTPVKITVGDQDFESYIAFAGRPPWPLNLPDRIPLVFPFTSQLRSTYLDRIPSMLAQAGANNPFALVFAADVGPDIDRTIPRPQVIIDANEFSEKIVKSPDPLDSLRKLVAERVDLRLISPYQPRGPISRPELYFGRKHEIEEILTHLGDRSHFLVGKRRAGKTSTLFVIENRLSQEGISGIKLLYDSLERVENYDNLRERLQDPWHLEIPAGPIDRSLVQALYRYKELQKIHMVLMWDEVDRLLDYDAGQGWPVFRALRAEALKPRPSFSLLLAGFSSLYRYLHDGSCPLFNFGPEIVLRQLDVPAVRDLIVKPMQSLGISIDEGLIEKIYRLTSGEASLVQFLCDATVDELRKSSDKTNRVVTAEMLDQASNTDAFVKEYLEITYGTFLSPLHRLVILCAVKLDSAEFEERALMNLVRNTRPTVAISEIQGAIALLTTYLFIRERRHLRWAMQMFPLIIRQHRDLDLEFESVLEVLDKNAQ